MQYLYYAALILGLYAAYMLSVFGRAWLQLRQARVGHQHSQQIERQAWPEAQRPIFLEAEQALTALGFQYSHSEEIMSTEVDFVLVEPIYVHAATQTYAQVETLSNPAGERYFDITFETVWRDGTILLSTNGATGSLLPPPPHYDLYCDEPASLEAIWESHQQHLQHEDNRRRVAVTFSPSSFMAYRNRAWQLDTEYKLSQGWLVPTHEKPEQWRYTCAARWKWFWRIQASAKKLSKTIDEQPPVSAELSPGQMAAERQAFQRWLESSSASHAGWRLKTILLLVSVLAFSISWGMAFSWYTVPILLGVLLVHELGHIAGMLAFGYRDFQLLFLPFLGAAVLWKRSEEATPWQKFVIYLLGPLPGIVLGLAALWLGDRYDHDVWYTIGLLALVLNYLNLLPVLPLDGGHIVNTLFLHRMPRAQFGLMLLSSMVFAASFWWTQHVLFALLALACALSLPEAWRWGKAVARLQQTQPASGSSDELLQATIEIFTTPPFNKKPILVWYQTVQRLWHHANTSPTPWRFMLLGAGVYVGSLVLPLYASPLDVFYRFGLTQVYQTLHGNTGWPPFAYEPALDYTCPVTAPQFSADMAAATRKYYPAKVVATFEKPEAIPEAMAWLEGLPTPPDHVVRMGQSLVATAFQELIPAPEVYHRELQALGAQMVFENVEVEPYFESATVVFMTCEATDTSTATRIVDEVELFQDVPDTAYVRPPWAAAPEVSEEQKRAEHRARRTYALIMGPRSRDMGAKEQELYRAMYVAELNQDHTAAERARYALSAYERAESEAWLNELLRRPDAEIDKTIVHQEIQYRRIMGDMAPGPRGIVLHRDQIRDINKRHDLALGVRMGQLPLENARPVGPGALMSTMVGDVEQQGKQLDFDFWMFQHIEFGLPAFVHYLCAQGCRNIKYTVADFNDVRGD